MSKAYKCDCCEKLFELTKDEKDSRIIRVQEWEDYKDGRDIYKFLDLCNNCYNKIYGIFQNKGEIKEDKK